MPDKNTNNLRVYCDGGSRGNPGLAASAFLVEDLYDQSLYSQGVFLGIATNNTAEYKAVLFAAKWLINNESAISQTKSITFYLDSLLVVNQLNGVFKIKDPNLKNLYSEISSILEKLKFINISFVYIPRAQNIKADFLVNQTLDSIM